MNNLILERCPNSIGLYQAEITIDGVYFNSVEDSWEKTINRLLTKIVWYFHGK